MDLTQIQLLTLDDIMREHTQWLYVTLPIIWAALAGALIRLLLVRSEPFWMRSQNAVAGLLLAITLAETTAHAFTGGNYTSGYAVVYGMVGRELFVTMHEFISEKATPVLFSVLNYFFPFLFNDTNEEDNKHDRS